MIDLMDDSLTILIGHHLVHDMGALKIAHGRFIDTSVVFDHFRGPMMKPALKWLAQRWLGKDIQSKRDRVGHCPEEDARTCAQLVRKKLEHGIGFGRAPRDTTSIFETLSERDLTTAYVGSAAPLYGSQATTVVDCNRDDEVGFHGFCVVNYLLRALS
jgi:RNA exonuclease 1